MQHAYGKMLLTMCGLPSEWLHGLNFGKHHHDRLHERRDLELENKISTGRLHMMLSV